MTSGELGKHFLQLYLLLSVFAVAGRRGEGCWGCCSVLYWAVCCFWPSRPLFFVNYSTICIYYLFLLALLFSANSLTTVMSWVCFPSPSLTHWAALSITSGRSPTTSSNQHGNVPSLSGSLMWVVWEVEMWETSFCSFPEDWLNSYLSASFLRKRSGRDFVAAQASPNCNPKSVLTVIVCLTWGLAGPVGHGSL